MKSQASFPGRGVQTRSERVAAFLLVSLISSPVIYASQAFSGECVGVSDGDTIKVLCSGREANVRLEGIDCPESGEPYSAKAKKFISSLVFGRIVTVSLANPLKSSYFDDCDLKK